MLKSKKDIEKDFISSASLAKVTDALCKIRLEYSRVVEVCCLQEFSYKETAKILGLKLGTVKSRLWRARKALSKYI